MTPRLRKIRFIRQRDTMQCGVACLAMISSAWGKKISIDSLNEIVPLSKDGVSLLSVAKGAETIGFSTKALLTSIESLREFKEPLILYWRQNHFVILEKIHSNRFHVVDPSKGRVILSYDEFYQNWISSKDERGIALSLEPTSDFKTEQSSVSIKKTRKILFNIILKYRKYFAHIILGIAVGCLLQLILPFLTQAIVDKGISNKDLSFIWIVLLGEIFIVAGRTAIDFIRRWIIIHISMRMHLSFIGEFLIKLFKLPMVFFESRHLGDMIQRMNDHGRIQSFLTDQTLSILFSLISFIVLSCVLLSYSLALFLIFIIGIAIYIAWVQSFLKARRVLDYESFEHEAINQSITHQLLTLMPEIKLQNCEKRRRQEWEDEQAELFNIHLKSQKLQQTQEAGSIFINEIKNVVITVFSANLVINGSITLGTMLAIQYIIGQLNSPVSQFVNFIYSFQELKMSLERINEVHNYREENPIDDVTSEISEQGSIDISNIYFRYEKYSPVYSIKGVSLLIPKGKITAIVGDSGSGKTTLLKLILGFYKLESGSISISGVDINSLDLKSWRLNCGVVMQDGAIFNESIARNIAIDDAPIDYNKVVTAAKMAMISEYVESLPLGYETIIGSNGRGLSQGQRQRILIARAIYRNPPYIILDEATNSLDSVNENGIVNNLREFFADKTVIVVAHRLSTVKDADQIIVMHQGGIEEIGNHDSLIKKRGRYFQLVKNQLDLPDA